MKAEELRDQLESLRNEVRGMGNVLARIQEEDVRWVYGEQIRSVLVEKTRRFFELESRQPGTEVEGTVRRTEEEAYHLIDRAVSTYQHLDKDKAIAILDERPSSYPERETEGDHLRYQRFIDDVNDQLRQYFVISMGWKDQIAIGRGSSVPEIDTPMDRLSPALVERTLSPLSNSIRYDLLTSLRTKEKGLTEMSKGLGLKKGHLQFHTRTLMDSGYISIDRRTHLYSLTTKGEVALTGIEELIRKMG
jgi:predicted transcriptional regulator